jgi:hypothetical protein
VPGLKEKARSRRPSGGLTRCTPGGGTIRAPENPSNWPGYPLPGHVMQSPCRAAAHSERRMRAPRSGETREQDSRQDRRQSRQHPSACCRREGVGHCGSQAASPHPRAPTRSQVGHSNRRCFQEQRQKDIDTTHAGRRTSAHPYLC